MSRVIDSLVFGLVYAVILGSTNPVDWLIGLALGALLPRVSAAPADLRRLLGVPRYAVGFNLLVLRGSVQVIGALLRPGGTDQCRDLDLPFGERSETGAAATAYAATAAPGTAVAELDVTRRRLILNAIDASDPDAVRADLERFYHRYQRPLLP